MSVLFWAFLIIWSNPPGKPEVVSAMTLKECQSRADAYAARTGTPVEECKQITRDDFEIVTSGIVRARIDDLKPPSCIWTRNRKIGKDC